MQPTHVPAAGDRYWVALSIASVFGANTGDFIAKYLHLGHWGGLPALAILLAVVFFLERRYSTVDQAYYWAAVLPVQTSATHLADLGAGHVPLGRAGLIAAPAVELAPGVVLRP